MEEVSCTGACSPGICNTGKVPIQILMSPKPECLATLSPQDGIGNSRYSIRMCETRIIWKILVKEGGGERERRKSGIAPQICCTAIGYNSLLKKGLPLLVLLFCLYLALKRLKQDLGSLALGAMHRISKWKDEEGGIHGLHPRLFNGNMQPRQQIHP